jgi:Zn-dependent protease
MSILLWGTLSAVGLAFLDLSAWSAFLVGLVATLLHWDSAIWHQLGHTWAARQTGYPMKGITLVGLLSASRYPHDEPELPAEIHIRRALGGPTASLMVSLVSGLAALALRPVGGAIWMVTVFWFLDNFLVFAIGSLLPLGFTDGSTLLYWWPRRGGMG